MEHTFTLTAILKTSFDIDALSKILNQGSKLELIYYDTFSEDAIGCKISSEKLLEKLQVYNYPSVQVRFQDTNFKLCFFKINDGSISISFWHIGYSWKQEFIEGNQIIDFDLARYTRLMAQLLEDFEISRIEAKVEDE